MHIYFINKRQEKLFNSEKSLTKKFGRRNARIIQQRLLDLNGVSNLSEMRLLPGRCHRLKGDREGQFALDLEHPKRLIFEPFFENDESSKNVELVEIKAVVIIGVIDYHD